MQCYFILRKITSFVILFGLLASRKHFYSWWNIYVKLKEEKNKLTEKITRFSKEGILTDFMNLLSLNLTELYIKMLYAFLRGVQLSLQLLPIILSWNWPPVKLRLLEIRNKLLGWYKEIRNGGKSVFINLSVEWNKTTGQRWKLKNLNQLKYKAMRIS